MPSVQSNESIATVHKVVEFSSAEFGTSFEAASIRKINMADTAAAAILHASPTVKVPKPSIVPSATTFALSKASKAVPPKATSAEIQVVGFISLPKRKNEKNGTNLTFK